MAMGRNSSTRESLRLILRSIVASFAGRSHGVLSLLSSILETCKKKMLADEAATPPERALVCPDLSRVARVGSGRFKRNIHGLVPTVPSCPDQKTTASAS